VLESRCVEHNAKAHRGCELRRAGQQFNRPDQQTQHSNRGVETCLNGSSSKQTGARPIRTKAKATGGEFLENYNWNNGPSAQSTFFYWMGGTDFCMDVLKGRAIETNETTRAKNRG
jgi:hypothetical protein